jgi:hypothetical protein
MTRHHTVENFQSFDVHDLHRVRALEDNLVSFPLVSFRWPGIVGLHVDVEFRGGATQRISLVWTRCHFGRGRPWFICVRCDQRVGKLYNTGASLTCRRCLRLSRPVSLAQIRRLHARPETWPDGIFLERSRHWRETAIPCRSCRSNPSPGGGRSSSSSRSGSRKQQRP